MELSELLKKIGVMQVAIKSRLGGDSTEAMQLYIQGYADGLDGVVTTIKKAIDAERMRQRLARLENELAQEVEPDWSQLPDKVTDRASGVPDVSTKNSVNGIDAI